jgi:hypothetical protein
MNITKKQYDGLVALIGGISMSSNANKALRILESIKLRSDIKKAQGQAHCNKMTSAFV